MSLGGLQNEGDLKRWLENQVATPGVLPPPSWPIRLGAGSVTFPGEAAESEPTVIEHGFNVIPYVFLQNAGGTAAEATLTVPEKTDEAFTIVALEFGKPAEGATVNFDWMAVSL